MAALFTLAASLIVMSLTINLSYMKHDKYDEGVNGMGVNGEATEKAYPHFASIKSTERDVN